MRGSDGTDKRAINIPWVHPDSTYQVKALFAGNNLGNFTRSDLINGKLNLSLPTFGQEILEITEQ